MEDTYLRVILAEVLHHVLRAEQVHSVHVNRVEAARAGLIRLYPSLEQVRRSHPAEVLGLVLGPKPRGPRLLLFFLLPLLLVHLHGLVRKNNIRSEALGPLLSLLLLARRKQIHARNEDVLRRSLAVPSWRVAPGRARATDVVVGLRGARICALRRRRLSPHDLLPPVRHRRCWG